MKTYQYVEQTDTVDCVIINMTEQQILEFYWEFWLKQMNNKFGLNHPLINRDNCIEDFCVVHWAQEI
jgi:hypothetical protein